MWARVPADEHEWRRCSAADTTGGGRVVRFACRAVGCPAVRTVSWGAHLGIAGDATAPEHQHGPPGPAAAAVAEGSAAVTRKRFPKLTEVRGWKFVQATEQAGRRTRRYGCRTPGCPARRVVVFDDERSVVVLDAVEVQHRAH